MTKINRAEIKKRRFPSLPVLLILFTLSGCIAPAPTVSKTLSITATGAQVEQAMQRGTLISTTPMVEMDADQVAAYLTAFGLDAAAVRYGVAVYQIVYHTVDTAGQPTTASGLVALPTNGRRDLQVVAWLHGTRVYRGEVASLNEESDDRRFVMAFASAGYAVSAPDYLGLGVSPGFHPWMDAGAAVTAALDALRATGTLAAQAGRRLDDQVLVSGFSQGGNSALALGRALQQGTDPHLRLGALAPISGGYGWSAWVRSALAGEVEPQAATIYLAYLSVAWNRLHHLYDSPGEAFRAPYDQTVETLFDNDHPIEQIFPALPATPKGLLTPEFSHRLQQPTGALQEAFHEADSVCDWQPQVTVHLYAASGDHEMPIASTIYCQRALQAQGADVKLIDVGDIDHFGSVLRSVPQVLKQFDGLPAHASDGRQGRIFARSKSRCRADFQRF